MIANVFYMCTLHNLFWGKIWSPKLLSALWYFNIKDRKLHNSTTQGNSQIVLQEGIYLKVPDTVSVNQPFSVKKNLRLKWTY